MQTDIIQYYHAHLYYDEATIEFAKKVAAEAHVLFGIRIGTFHERPVGPHPVWSCELTVPVSLFGEVVPWLALKRGALNIFVHPITGDDIVDHTKHVMWLGQSFALNLDGLN
jgi:aromatic ring-cleaving dioxygenase